MADQSNNQQVSRRDGTGQADRLHKALSPDYVLMDERTVKDLLAFARAYASELRYFNLDNQEMGDWRAFLDSSIDLDDVIAFMQEPDQHRDGLHMRPHVVLFLTFIELLRYAQDHLNTLTRRHLDYYYQRVLSMSKRPGISDYVHVLVDLAPKTKSFRLPQGTLLTAGPDSTGQDRLYRTDRDMVVNHGQIAQIRSLYAEKRVTGLHEARTENQGTAQDRFMEMLRIALGHPAPGDPLPEYVDDQGETEVTYEFLLAQKAFLDFVPDHLFMTFDDLKQLIQLKRQAEQPGAAWQHINTLLEKAGQARTGDPGFQLQGDPRDFFGNLRQAMGGDPDFEEDTIPEVDDIYDLYEQRIRRKQAVETFIRERLFFENVEDFYTMMRMKILIDKIWAEINLILEAAGSAKHGSDYGLPVDAGPPDFDIQAQPPDFDAKLNAALGPLSYPEGTTDLNTYEERLRALEDYFFMQAGEFSTLMMVAEDPETTPREWDWVYRLLTRAYQQKVYAERRQQLRDIRELDGLAAMLWFAVGNDDRQSDLDPLDRLQEFIPNETDQSFLDDIVNKDAEGENISTRDWQRVYTIVELAQRARLGEPVPQKERWINLHPAPDATALTSTNADSGNLRWATFGRPQPAPQDAPPPPAFGWAIRSPMLMLSQGKRTITLILGFEETGFDQQTVAALLENDGGPFAYQISSEKGWVDVAPEQVSTETGTYHALTGITPSGGNDERATLPAIKFTLTLTEAIDPIVPFADDPAARQWPVFKVLLRPDWQHDDRRFITHYQPLKSLVLARVHLGVDVTGLTPSHMQNDESTLAVGKPFEPFGIRPAVGSRFYFSHPELVVKKLGSLAFDITWMGVPDDFLAHYRNYSAHIDKDSFTTRISLVDNRLDVPLATDDKLFGDEINIEQVPDEENKPAGYVYRRAAQLVTDNNLLNWNRYLQWELNAPDFQHSAYPADVTAKSVELAAKIANRDTVNAEEYKVPPPYTPKIKQLLIGYTASEEIVLKVYQPGHQPDTVLHIQPFGYNEIQPDTSTGRCSFLPQYDYEGELYIGIQNSAPPQNLSLLFQLAPGSGDPDSKPGPVLWSYLSGNQWISLEEGHVLEDTTRGLINSGIITFSLQPATPNTLLPPGLYWLRAAIPYNSAAINDTVAIHAQAISATFADHDNAPDHLQKPLPENSITDLAKPVPQIAGIRQPYTSFGGRMPEQDHTFYTRISERLRHKNRALTMWDYEHMVLEQFPQIYKVKCLPDPEQPGDVNIIVIPDIRNRLPFDPFEPKAPADLIADIESYLAEHIPPFASITVKNARYVKVKVRFAVRFRPGFNEGYYKQQLNTDLNRFLSPWAYDEGEDIVIGGRIYANVIVNFIEERDYVDYVAGIHLFVIVDGEPKLVPRGSAEDGYWVEADEPDSVLVAAQQHEIDMISGVGFVEEHFTGINYMKIELDFIVAANPETADSQ